MPEAKVAIVRAIEESTEVAVEKTSRVWEGQVLVRSTAKSKGEAVAQRQFRRQPGMRVDISVRTSRNRANSLPLVPHTFIFYLSVFLTLCRPRSPERKL